jgi:hypothetical protein
MEKETLLQKRKKKETHLLALQVFFPSGSLQDHSLRIQIFLLPGGMLGWVCIIV